MVHFSRRNFVKTMGLGFAATSFPLIRNIPSGKLDLYGGLKSVRFDKTGFFRVHKSDRWWLVTPEGSAFLSYGLNHMDMGYMLQDYNIDFWKEKFGSENQEDPAFIEGFRKKVMDDLELLEMNTFGCHGNKDVFGEITVPYIQALFFARTAYWIVTTPNDYPDVYSSQFKERCDNVAKRVVAPRKNDPYLIGYTFTNVPILTDMDSYAHGMVAWGKPQPEMPTWPRALRNRGAETPGKNRYVDLMKERYSSIGNFNRVYKTNFADFDSLLNAVNWSPFNKNPDIIDGADNDAFMLDIYEKYYTVTTNAVRKYDSNHLIFGDPINANTGTTDEIISLVTKHTDLLPYQYYGPYADHKNILDHWSKLTGKPIFNTDSSFAFPDKDRPNPVGYIVDDPQTMAAYFLDMATQAFQRPDFIGWNWCGWMDSKESWRPIQQHSGLQDPYGNFHNPMPKVMSKFGSNLYEYGLGKKEAIKVSEL
jgi:hypothetical protein